MITKVMTQAVEHGLDQLRGDGLRDRFLRSETRHHVAEVTRLEIGGGEIDQMRE
jgi:hypothetical protein